MAMTRRAGQVPTPSPSAPPCHRLRRKPELGVRTRLEATRIGAKTRRRPGQDHKACTQPGPRRVTGSQTRVRRILFRAVERSFVASSSARAAPDLTLVITTAIRRGQEVGHVQQ